MSKLAINGGKKVREKPFPFCTTIGAEEVEATTGVLKTGVLSRYLGTWHKDFYGGPKVQELERVWAETFGAKHAISVNSATSGLIAAVGALGIEPGDEVIVTPYSMCISATAPLWYGAIPVFADVEEDYFCLDPDSIEERITSRTKAILIVDLFGQPYDVDRINTIAKKHNIKIIEDAAQAIGSKYKDAYAGTLGDIGVFSLNYHKHIHAGEGGIVVTNDDNLAERVQLIRNHAEAVVPGKGVTDLTNMIGLNVRMTEVEAVIAHAQLKKLPELLEQRLQNVAYLTEKLEHIPFLKAGATRPHATHVYYMQPFFFNAEKAGIDRNTFLDAVKAELPFTENREHEGVQINVGYIKPLYLLPLFQERIAFGSSGYPFTLADSTVSYEKGICSVVERLYEQELFLHDFARAGMSQKDLNDVVVAFEKVADNISELHT